MLDEINLKLWWENPIVEKISIWIFDLRSLTYIKTLKTEVEIAVEKEFNCFERDSDSVCENFSIIPRNFFMATTLFTQSFEVLEIISFILESSGIADFKLGNF